MRLRDEECGQVRGVECDVRLMRVIQQEVHLPLSRAEVGQDRRNLLLIHLSRPAMVPFHVAVEHRPSQTQVSVVLRLPHVLCCGKQLVEGEEEAFCILVYKAVTSNVVEDYRPRLEAF